MESTKNEDFVINFSYSLFLTMFILSVDYSIVYHTSFLLLTVAWLHFLAFLGVRHGLVVVLLPEEWTQKQYVVSPDLAHNISKQDSLCSFPFLTVWDGENPQGSLGSPVLNFLESQDGRDHWKETRKPLSLNHSEVNRPTWGKNMLLC